MTYISLKTAEQLKAWGCEVQSECYYIEDDDLPVIVFIKGSGSKGHYVVIHGYDDKNDDFVVHDPYWGSNLLLGTSKKIVKSIYGSASIDQMIVYKSD